MDGLRAKITPSVDAEGFLCVKVEWVDVEESLPGEVKYEESFRIGPDKAGSSYFSRVVIQEADVATGTFYLDPQGKRHFHFHVDAGKIHLTRQESDLAVSG